MGPACLLFLLVQEPADSRAPLETLLREHCVECHSGDLPKADLDLGALVDPERPSATERGTLERVREVLALGEMPPARRPRPPADVLTAARGWLEAELGPTPARPALRRLNRAEYEHAVRDLLGLAYPARELFPADDVGERFDNDAVAASVSELHVERWVEAAEALAERALPPDDGSETRVFEAGELGIEGGGSLQHTNVNLYSAGAVSITAAVSSPSRYRLELEGWGDLAGPERPRVVFEVDGRKVGHGEFSVEAPARETLDATFDLAAGMHGLAARFVNDHYAPDAEDPGERDRNVHVARLTLIGPLDPPPATAFTRRVDAALARGSLEEVLAEVGRRVWRRPLEADEVERLAALSSAEDSPRRRVRAALAGLLASPHFLYKVERADAGPTERAFQLASRLSFFLWASGPDDALLDLASTGQLARPETLRAQVHRLLADARSRSLVEAFGAQWLGWRMLERVAPDHGLFPEADATLLSSMRQESEAFFEAMLREDRPLDEFLSPHFAFVDARLARLYGLEGVEGEGVRRVPVEDPVRGGLLGQAALLTASSNPTRTSPVKRGKWILETLLGERVPPPPPGVGVLAEGDDAPRTVRERLEQHRADPGCAACHAQLDPLGLALEGFDAIGRARTREGDAPLDTTGRLPDGTTLEGAAGLRDHLAASGRFPHALARALFLYALGREPDVGERAALERDVDALGTEERTLARVIELVASSEAFLGTGP